jgi:hypothetical protein
MIWGDEASLVTVLNSCVADVIIAGYFNESATEHQKNKSSAF